MVVVLNVNPPRVPEAKSLCASDADEFDTGKVEFPDPGGPETLVSVPELSPTNKYMSFQYMNIIFIYLYFLDFEINLREE